MKNMEKREPAPGAPLPAGGGGWKRGSKAPPQPPPPINFSGARHDPDLMPHSISPTSTSTECCFEFATHQWLSSVASPS